MRSLGIAELKALLSETLARVKAGEEVMITEHGRPIARILPLSAASPAAATQELVRMGQVRAPEKPLDEAFWKLPRGQYRDPYREPPNRDEDQASDLWELREAV
jgi:prevent-host-death family protein